MRLDGSLFRLSPTRFPFEEDSAAWPASDGAAPDPRIDGLLARLGQGSGPSPRVPELNPKHTAVKAVLELHRSCPRDPRLEAYAHLLHRQALLAEGSRLEDPTSFTAALNSLLEKDAVR